MTAAAWKAVLAGYGFIAILPVHSQILHAAAPLPSFEVSTIRPWQPAPPPMPASDGAAPKRPAKISPGAPGGQQSDRVHLIGQVSLLIGSAYHLPPGRDNQIVGGPDWMRQESDRYEIQAKIESSLYAAMQTMTPAQQREQVELMEQSLLADRLKLKVHFETREAPGYALVVAKGGPKLTPATDTEQTKLSALDSEQGTEMTATAVTLDAFAHSPLIPGGRPVEDQTGLKGTYDFTLKYRSERLIAAAGTSQESGPEAPSFLTAIEEQLGLKLVPTKVPIEVIVVDHIERPSEN